MAWISIPLAISIKAKITEVNYVSAEVRKSKGKKHGHPIYRLLNIGLSIIII